MINTDLVRMEAGHYRLLAEKLRQEFAGIDDETLKDTLEGISRLPEMLEEIIRSSLDDEAIIFGLKTRLDIMGHRIARLKDRYEKKRKLVASTMGGAQIDKFEVPEFSVSLSHGQVKLLINESVKLPDAYLVPQPPKPDRAALTAALKRGEAIEGACLGEGDPYITVRTR